MLVPQVINSHVLTVRDPFINKAIHVLLICDFIYTCSGPPRKARAKPSNQHD